MSGLWDPTDKQTDIKNIDQWTNEQIEKEREREREREKGRERKRKSVR